MVFFDIVKLLIFSMRMNVAEATFRLKARSLATNLGGTPIWYKLFNLIPSSYGQKHV